MKNQTRTFAAAAIFILAAAFASCGKDREPSVPVITIETQPAAPAALTQGNIPADTRLTVAASVTEGAFICPL